MLIPLGILGASGAGLIPDYELISSTVLGSAASSVVLNSIPTDYKHLQVRLTVKSANVTSNRDLFVRLNGITTSSYVFHRLRGGGSTVASNANTGTTSIGLFNIVEASNTSGVFGAAILDVIDYGSTSKNTTIRALSGLAGATNTVNLNSGLLNNTAAITSITFFADSGNLSSGSRFSLYGIRG
jgi:hypothetical protein